MTKNGRELIQGLKQFVHDLEAGKPIKVTDMRIIQTPNGPLTTRVKRVLRYRSKKDKD